VLGEVIIDAAFGRADGLDSRGRWGMLSDHERKTLLDVERRFIAEDPEFARSFDDQLHRQPAAQGGSNGKIAVAVALLFSAILLLAGFPTGALACVITTGVTCAMWRFLKDPDPRTP
jgi:hypothetical protein